MAKKSLFLAIGLALAALIPATSAQTNQTDKVETKAQRDARMAWWREAKFGMFIHWGLYAIPAGGEWHMRKNKVPMAEYQSKTTSRRSRSRGTTRGCPTFIP